MCACVPACVSECVCVRACVCVCARMCAYVCVGAFVDVNVLLCVFCWGRCRFYSYIKLSAACSSLGTKSFTSRKRCIYPSPRRHLDLSSMSHNLQHIRHYY